MANAESVHQEVLTLWNARDFDAMREMFHPDYAYMSADGSAHAGPDAGIEIAKMYAAAFPDARAEITNSFASGNKAVAEFRVRGTQTGDLPDIPATGKPIDILVCNICELKDGLIAIEHEYFDNMAMMVQLGVIGAPEAKEQAAGA